MTDDGEGMSPCTLRKRKGGGADEQERAAAFAEKRLRGALAAGKAGEASCGVEGNGNRGEAMEVEGAARSGADRVSSSEDDDPLPRRLVVRNEAGGAWRAVFQKGKRQREKEGEGSADAPPKRPTLGAPAPPSVLPLAVVERSAVGGVWKAVKPGSSTAPPFDAKEDVSTLRVPAVPPPGSAPPLEKDPDELPVLVVQRNSIGRFERVVQAEDGNLYFAGSVESADVRDQTFKDPTTLMQGGMTIDEVLRVYDEHALSLAIGKCANLHSLHFLHSKLFPDETIGERDTSMQADVYDVEPDDAYADFNHINACYRVLFQLVDTVLMDCLGELPLPEGFEEGDLSIIGQMTRPCHLLEELFDILRLVRQSEYSAKPLTVFEFHSEVLSVWRQGIDTGDETIMRLVGVVSKAFDELFMEHVYEPMARCSDDRYHIPNVGTTVRFYDDKEHEWWAGSVKQLVEDGHVALVERTRPREGCPPKVWVRIPSMHCRILSPSEHYLLDTSQPLPTVPGTVGPDGVLYTNLGEAAEPGASASADPEIVSPAYFSQRHLLQSIELRPGPQGDGYEEDGVSAAAAPLQPPPQPFSLVPEPLPRIETAASSYSSSEPAPWKRPETDAKPPPVDIMGVKIQVNIDFVNETPDAKTWIVDDEERPDYDAIIDKHVEEHGDTNWEILDERFPEMRKDYFKNRHNHLKAGTVKRGSKNPQVGKSMEQRMVEGTRYDDAIRAHIKEHGTAKWGLLEKQFPEKVSKGGRGLYFIRRYSKVMKRQGYF